MSTVEDYLDDLDDIDLSDYGLDEDLDIDWSDLSTSTSSASEPTSTVSDWIDDASDGTTSSSSSSSTSLGALGSDYSVQGTSSSCASEVAFKTTGPRVDLAFDVIFLVAFIAIAVFTVLRLLKMKKSSAGAGSSFAKWLLFPVSIFLAILYLFIDTLTLILTECVIMRYDKYQQAATATAWFNSISIFLLMIAVLLPICLDLQRSGSSSGDAKAHKFATLTLYVHSAWLGLTGLFLLVSLAVYSHIQDSLYRTGDTIDIDLVRSARNLSMTYYVFLFLAALLGVANMGFALVKKESLRRGKLPLLIPTLALSTLTLTLVLMGGFADTNYGDAFRSWEYFERSGDAQVFLSRLFYAVAFVAALLVAAEDLGRDDAAAYPASGPVQVLPMTGSAPSPVVHGPVKV
ncbi:uncharacterized protein DSM5745_09252 [Aspergillus mulundensis]|uniref:Uncharacterized protein n=1 Tax=Aspergillus mulundensis TaxID=1810919 RepID=A0A3D8R012_9EURO|nr:hypothetical protein DSM5745_09252 [Aspergillus mulundensis]RDW67386.1 hypothetical protein DSM5745_09252 [Aspergillus mulundensis]